MVTRIGFVAAAVALVMIAPVVSAKDNDRLDKQSAAVVEEAFTAIQSGEPQRALTLVEPVIANFEKANAGRQRIYCAVTAKESAFYMVAPASEGGASTEPAPDGDTPDQGTSIILNSNWCRAQYVRAFALVDLKRLDEAQAGYERLLRFAPKRSRYLSELGFVFQAKRQWQASLDLYVRADAAADVLDPADRDYERCVALRGQGYDLVELGRLDDAEAAYRKCLAITPNEPKSLGEIEYIKEQRRKTT